MLPPGPANMWLDYLVLSRPPGNQRTLPSVHMISIPVSFRSLFCVTVVALPCFRFRFGHCRAGVGFGSLRLSCR
jgi:hypothetical protein